MKFCRNFADNLENVDIFWNFELSKDKFRKIPILKEFEWFEWFGPPPIEPFNSGRCSSTKNSAKPPSSYSRERPHPPGRPSSPLEPRTIMLNSSKVMHLSAIQDSVGSHLRSSFIQRSIWDVAPYRENKYITVRLVADWWYNRGRKSKKCSCNVS